MQNLKKLALIFVAALTVLSSIANASYVANDPVNATDPDGRQALDQSARYRATLELAGGDVNKATAGMADGLTKGVIATGGVVLAGAVGIEAFAAVAANPATTTELSVAAGELTMGDAAGPGLVAGGIALADDVGELSAAVMKNVERFFSKQPAASTGVVVDKLGDGVIATSEVPGKVPGSKAVYQKTIDADGNTTGMTKTTFDPKGEEVHTKDKFNE